MKNKVIRGMLVVSFEKYNFSVYNEIYNKKRKNKISNCI